MIITSIRERLSDFFWIHLYGKGEETWWWFLSLLWRLPTVAHTLVCKVTGVRLVKVTAITGFTYYFLSKKWPPEPPHYGVTLAFSRAEGAVWQGSFPVVDALGEKFLAPQESYHQPVWVMTERQYQSWKETYPWAHWYVEDEDAS